MTPEAKKKLVDELIAFNKGTNVADQNVASKLEDVETMSIQRYIRKKKGSWWQVPKDLPDAKEP